MIRQLLARLERWRRARRLRTTLLIPLRERCPFCGATTAEREYISHVREHLKAGRL